MAVPNKIESFIMDCLGSGPHTHPTKREVVQAMFDKVLLF